MTTLIVDSRENKLIPLLTANSTNFTTSQLDVGDFQYQIDGEVKLVIERKTYADLAGSIQSGRYKEQKIRLQQFQCPLKAYLIEGAPPKKLYGRINADALDSAVLGTALRDGFVTIHSTNINHSVKLLTKLIKKLPEYLKESKTAIEIQDEYLKSSISTVKKENLTVEDCYLSQLCQIPGVSISTAKAIIGKYYCLFDLLNAISQDREAVLDHLTNLKISSKRMGESLATRIVNYLEPRVKVRTMISIKKK